MPKMQRNDSVELSSLFPHRPSNWPNTRKCLRKLTSVDSEAPCVGTEDPWNVSSEPNVISVRGLMSPSPFRSVNVYGVPQYPPAGYPTCWRCVDPPNPKMMGVPIESVLRTRFLLPQALAVTFHCRSDRLSSCAVSSSSYPLLLTSPRLSNRVKLSPIDGASCTAMSPSFESLS